MISKKSYVINGANSVPILIDVFFNKNYKKKRIILFSHGFKGFKDWGPFNIMADYFANNGFVFIKFNFSHNGTSIDSPSDFVNLNLFGNNNLCKELDDLGFVIDWLFSSGSSNIDFSKEINLQSISLIGHSRGGVISILKSFEDSRISNVVSWSSPSNLLKRLPTGEKLKKWRENNILNVYNGRTKQNMPLYYQFYQNCINNLERLNLYNAISCLKIPHLHIHGDSDDTISIAEAYDMKSWNEDLNLCVIKGGDHVFNSFHPYIKNDLPKEFKTALEITVKFLKR